MGFEFDNLSFPLSLQLMIECITRVQTRKVHDTLPGNGVKSLEVMSMFLGMFRGNKLSKIINYYQ
jgi:hypothetical protein